METAVELELQCVWLAVTQETKLALAQLKKRTAQIFSDLGYRWRFIRAWGSEHDFHVTHSFVNCSYKLPTTAEPYLQSLIVHNIENLDP